MTEVSKRKEKTETDVKRWKRPNGESGKELTAGEVGGPFNELSVNDAVEINLRLPVVVVTERERERETL